LSLTFCSREQVCFYPTFSVQNTTGWIIVNCLNLVTIAIPPALPLALSIGLSVSFTRLQTKKIFCINPPRIVNAGRVNTACFDKTGTLTEDGLSLRGVCAVQEADAGSALALSDIQADVQKLYLEAHQVRNGGLPLLDGGGSLAEAEAELTRLLREG
jgi:P-type E1-E2 ATPase